MNDTEKGYIMKTLFVGTLMFCFICQSVVAYAWQQKIVGSMPTPIYLIVEDLDEDGDLDVAAGGILGSVPVDSEVAWFENNNGSFSKHIISPSSPPSAAIQNAEGLACADVDRDGQKDIAVATGVMGDLYGGMYWFKSPPGFQEAWTRFSIYEPTVGNTFFKVYSLDANDDTCVFVEIDCQVIGTDCSKYGDVKISGNIFLDNWARRALGTVASDLSFAEDIYRKVCLGLIPDQNNNLISHDPCNIGTCTWNSNLKECQ